MATPQDGVEAAWAIQAAPRRVPGLLGRWRGHPPSADAADLTALARDLHAFLSADPRAAGLRWRVDGDPSEAGACAPGVTG